MVKLSFPAKSYSTVVRRYVSPSLVKMSEHVCHKERFREDENGWWVVKEGQAEESNKTDGGHSIIFYLIKTSCSFF